MGVLTPVARGRLRVMQAATSVFLASAMLAGCGSDARDVLGSGLSGSAQLVTRPSAVGTPHYFGYTPLSVGGTEAVTLLSATVVGAARGDVAVQVWAAPFNGHPYVGGADGDAALAKEWPDLVRKPLRGAVMPAKSGAREPFYLLFRVVAERPGRITITGLQVTYRLAGETLSHVFKYSVVIDDGGGAAPSG